MDSDSVTMETDDEESSMDEEEEEEEEFEPKQEVWVQSSSDAKSYKPVHLNISYQMGDEGQAGNDSQPKKQNKGNDPTALAILRRLSPELQQGYRILIDLMGDRCKSFAWPFMDRVDPVALKLPDYYDRIKTPMWLTRIEEKFEKVEYTSISEFVADIRQIFENCYRYNGLKHMVSRQAQVMECHFEQKLTQLSRHIRDKTHFKLPSDQQTPEQDTTTSSAFGRRVSQRILESRTTMTPVADAMQKVLEREEEERRKQRIIERKAELERLNKRLVEWEKEELLVEPLNTQLKSMWEIPALGQFLKLCRENMFLPEFSIFELERALVLPQSSKLLARIFTNVLTTRYNRKRVSKKPAMPYEFWQDKLRKKLDIWYAFLSVESATRESVARHLYISERFFEVLGDGNPLTGRQFHDLAIYERVWILKGMCDHLFETDYDVWFGVDTSVIEDQRAVVLGEDDDKCSYLYFPHFLDTDLRIYRQAQIREDKPKKKKAEKAEKSPRKKNKKEDEKTDEGPKKRGRPRKTSEDDGSSPVKTGKTPARTSKTSAKASKTPATPASEGPKKRGRPRKNPETESESEPASASKETVGGTESTAQSTPGARSGRGRPRKDGTTQSQALKKTPAKPTAVVTPTRRSSRRAARLEKAEQEEQEEEEKEEGSIKDRTDEVCSPRVPGAAGESLEQSDLNCERTVSADVVCGGNVGTLQNQSGGGVGTSENKHLEMTSAENAEAAIDDLSGEDDGRTNADGVSQVGASPSDVKGDSPSEHTLCNGVMDVDETDDKIPMHSIDSKDDEKDDEKTLSKSESDQNKPEEEIANANHIQVASSDKLQSSVGPTSLEDTQQIENSITKNGASTTLNQNQSNNVMDIDDKVDKFVGGKDQSDNIMDTGHEVVADVPSDNIMKIGGKVLGEIQSSNIIDNGEKVESRDMDTVDTDCKDSIHDPDSMVTQGSALKEEITPQDDCPMDEDKDSKDVSAQDGHPSQESNTDDAVQRDPPFETGTEAEMAPKEEAMDHVLQEQMEGDVKPEEKVEVIERTPTPTPNILPGILPPEGEFELVCDSVEAFRQLIEKFAQKEETITKGRKTIVQPIKRSGRTIELHKTLSKMLEDFEPVEAKLQKVIHKAREVVYNESEAYKKDPSPNQEAAAFWYQIHVKKPAPTVESSSVEASSVDDDFSSSESSSELDSDEISDPDSEDDDETAEYDGSDTASVQQGAADELNGSEADPQNQGEKVDLYSGVEIAGRTMRSSKRRRAQKREVIRDKKKAKRSKIQIVKGAPLQGRYAQADEDEETNETKLKKVHEELKQNLKAGSTFQMTKHIVPGSSQKNFQPYKKAVLPTSSRHSAVKKEMLPAYQRDTSEKFIRILKRTAGTSEPATVAQISKPVKSPHEPTLKVPFLQKSKPTVQPVADAPSGDKKMKTETFSFTIDAKIWESLKDKPEERQRLIVEHVEKMRVAGGPKKEPPQKVQNSRLSPWFSRNTSPSSTSKSTIAAGVTDGSSLPESESAEKRLNSSNEYATTAELKQKKIPEVQEHMPILDPVGNQKGTLLQNTNMPTLAPIKSQKIVLGSPGSISLQQACSTFGQTQGVQPARSGNQSTAIASSSGNNQSQSLIPGGISHTVGTSLLGGLGTTVHLQQGTKGLSTIGVKPQPTILSVSPNPQGAQQLASPPDINRLANLKVQSVAAQPTAGGTGAGKTIVLPTNLKVNMHNKQYKILYVQKPGASKPELCLQPCVADGTSPSSGTLQGAVPLVTMQQTMQPVPAASSGGNMQIQMVPQGSNKIVMQAVGATPQAQVMQNVLLQSPQQMAQNVLSQNPLQAQAAQNVILQSPQIAQNVMSQNPLQAQAVQNVVLQSPVVAPQVVNPAAGSNTSVVTMISTPIPPVPQAEYALRTGTHAPLASIPSRVPAGSTVSVMSAPSAQICPVVQVPSVSVVPPSNQGIVLAGSPSKAVANQMVQLVHSGAVAPQSNLILQAASASGLDLPAPEPSMKQIIVQGMPKGTGQ